MSKGNETKKVREAELQEHINLLKNFILKSQEQQVEAS